MRVLVVPDKFKSTLTARQAARAIATGWSRVRASDALDLLPMTDGGDGFGRIMGWLLGAKDRRVRTVDAAHRELRASWWWAADGRTAVIESAQVIGLARLPKGRYHPFEIDTAGLGEVLRVASRSAPRRCLIGIGGSATNDAGFGMARALGWSFLDGSGRPIDDWPSLHRCEEMRAPDRPLELGRLRVAVDVENPLLGETGCTRVYGPQKGLHASEFETAERALGRLARVARTALGRDVADAPGAGAAGGLGFGLMAFLGARAVTGFSVFAEESGLSGHLQRADLVITGEGLLDRQSVMGKGVGELASLCSALEVPCLALVGHSDLPNPLRTFARVHAMSELASLDRSLERPAFWLARLAERAASKWDREPFR